MRDFTFLTVSDMTSGFRPVHLALILLATPAGADCEFCPENLSLSQDLAVCFLERVESERIKAETLGLPVALIDLGDCETSRSAFALPEPLQNDDAGMALDTSFLIGLDALSCLAYSLRAEAFNPDKIKTFEVRSDCIGK